MPRAVGILVDKIITWRAECRRFVRLGGGGAYPRSSPYPRPYEHLSVPDRLDVGKGAGAPGAEFAAVSTFLDTTKKAVRTTSAVSRVVGVPLHCSQRESRMTVGRLASHFSQRVING